MPNRKPYPSDVSDEEWALVAPYLALVREDAPQRNHNLREALNGLRRWVVRTGSPWAIHATRSAAVGSCLPADEERWLSAGVFEEVVHDLRKLLRISEGRAPDPTMALSHLLDSRTLRSTPESVARGGYDGAKRKKVSKVRAAAVDTLGHLLALHVTPADKQDRKQVGAPAEAAQEATGGGSMELAYVDQGYTGERPASKARAHGMKLEVVKRPEAKRGFVLLPRRWVVKRGLAWTSRFRRRLVKDYERLPSTVAGLHFVAFACVFLRQATAVLGTSP